MKKDERVNARSCRNLPGTQPGDVRRDKRQVISPNLSGEQTSKLTGLLSRKRELHTLIRTRFTVTASNTCLLV